jgi:Alcohol dehydrogenase transcription factor Myb/SANT-like
MTDSRYWSKEVVTEFIEIYKCHPCLWKIKSRDYTNRNLKNAAYEKLVQFCKKNRSRSKSGLCC